MTTDTNQAIRSRSLISHPTWATAVRRGRPAAYVSWFILQPTSTPTSLRAPPPCCTVSALAGLALRVSAQQPFGRALSLHQSLSFEVVTQLLQAVSPLMPRRALETDS